jgi:hypothetical protein
MGFLDHSTNNIIVDAVLTDFGRQQLSNGTFNVTKFAFGDDEVDYGLITKYGRVVGKEKIEKNTPVFEAQTSRNRGLKYRLISIPSRPALKKMPFVDLVTDGDGGLKFTISSTGENQNTKTLSISTKVPDGFGTTSDSSLNDASVFIQIPTLFFDPPTVGGGGVGGANLTLKGTVKNMAVYEAGLTTNNTALTIANTSITLTVKSLGTDVWNLYGLPNNRNEIKGVISVFTGTTGLTKSIDFQINKT